MASAKESSKLRAFISTLRRGRGVEAIKIAPQLCMGRFLVIAKNLPGV